MNILAFDIETIPDLDGGRCLYGFDGLSDEDVGRGMFQKRRQDTGGSEFLPLHLQRVAAVSIALRNRDGFKVWTLGTPESDEKEIITRFFEGIEKFGPDLVSWNGSGFDLPVLNYRALRHGISAPRLWGEYVRSASSSEAIRPIRATFGPSRTRALRTSTRWRTS